MLDGLDDDLAGHCCITVKGVLASGKVGGRPSGALENRNNQAFEGLLRGFWAGRWTSLGAANAQCNSAVRRATRVQSTGERWQRFARSDTGRLVRNSS